MSRNSGIGIGIRRGRLVAIGIIACRGGTWPAGGVASGRRATIGVTGLAGRLPARQSARLPGRIALSIVAGVTTAESIARTVLGIGQGGRIDNVGTRSTRPGCGDPIVPHIGRVLDDLVWRASIG